MATTNNSTITATTTTNGAVSAPATSRSNNNNNSSSSSSSSTALIPESEQKKAAAIAAALGGGKKSPRISDLPSNVFRLIFDFYSNSSRDFRTLLRVCRTINKELCNDEERWKRFALYDFRLKFRPSEACATTLKHWRQIYIDLAKFSLSDMRPNHQLCPFCDSMIQRNFKQKHNAAEKTLDIVYVQRCLNTNMKYKKFRVPIENEQGANDDQHQQLAHHFFAKKSKTETGSQSAFRQPQTEQDRQSMLPHQQLLKQLEQSKMTVVKKNCDFKAKYIFENQACAVCMTNQSDLRVCGCCCKNFYCADHLGACATCSRKVGQCCQSATSGKQRAGSASKIKCEDCAKAERRRKLNTTTATATATVTVTATATIGSRNRRSAAGNKSSRAADYD